ncbi:MAG: hypothetical protein AB7S26_25795 [Sandaracinaceae bacterium]
MLDDTEAPRAPLDWIAPIHGELVLVNRVLADSYVALEPRENDANETTIAGGVLGAIDRGAGTSLVLKDVGDASARSSIVVSEDGTSFFVVTHLDGEGGPDLRVAARDVPDDDYDETDSTFDVGFVGVVLFDGSSSWEMASERMLYAFAEVKKGTYAIAVSEERETEGGKRYRVIRFRKS